MDVRKCINCMNDLDGDICKYCGFDHKNAEPNPLGLKWNTILRGRYLVGNILGQGGFGITYVGLDLVLNLKVAIKEYYPMGQASRDQSVSNLIRWNTHRLSKEDWQQGCESFLKEARKMARVNDVSGVVRVRDTFYENQTAYIVMDFVEGITLKDWLKKNGIISYAQCVSLMEPLMRDLAKVHQAGLIHRDISPDNIMVRPDGSLCLLDLGAAKDMQSQQNGRSQLVTKSGFSPAEQYIETGKVGTWTDVYALCATMYYCITGKLVPDAMERAMGDSFNLDTLQKDTVSTVALNVLKFGLAIKPEERMQSVEALLNGLKAGFKPDTPADDERTDSGISDKKKKPKEKKSKKKKSKKGLIALIAGAILFVIVLIAAMGSDDSSEEESSEAASSEETSYDDTIPEDVLSVVKLGNSNANIWNDGGYAMIPGEYEYFIDQDMNLNVCAYDGETQTFYIDTSTVAAEGVTYINVSDDAVYFRMDTEDEYVNQICKMNPDGSNMEVLVEEGDFYWLQYAELSNGKEYLYALDLQNEMIRIMRLDLSNNKMEYLITDDIMWFNVYGDSLYYIRYENNDSVLVKCDLDGNNETVLHTGGMFLCGFVEEDHFYLYSDEKECLVQLNMEGEILQEYHEIPITDDFYTFSYGNEWLYYANRSDATVHRVRTDGTGDETILEGGNTISICYCEDWIWVCDGTKVDEVTELSYVYLAYRDGSSLLNLTDTLSGDSSEEGIEDVVDENLPWLDAPEGAAEDFSWELTDNGLGVVITGYTGDLLSFCIPAEIDGYPVLEIGEKAFYESAVEEVQLPNSVETIQEYAFAFSEISYLGLSSNLQIIEPYAIECCYSLFSVVFPASLQVIDQQAFWGSNLQKVYIPQNVYLIGQGAFGYLSSSFEAFEVHPDNQWYYTEDGVLFEAAYAALTAFPSGRGGDYTVPDGIEIIEVLSFARNDNIVNVTFPDSVVEIRDRAFYHCDELLTADVKNAFCTVHENAFTDSEKVAVLGVY